jgi:hypothetical protein
MAETRVTISHHKKEAVRIDPNVFVVTRIEAEPVQGSHTVLTIHFARNPKEMEPGKQKKRRSNGIFFAMTALWH